MRDQLAEHLKFAAELGVTGVSKDSAWRARRRSGPDAARMRVRPRPPRPPSTARSRSLQPRRWRRFKPDIGDDCRRCKLHTLGRKQIVFGVGNPNADLMFVGRGAWRRRRPAGHSVCRPRRTTADEDHRSDRSEARRCVHRERDQVPSAAEPKSRAGRSGHL